MAISEDTAALVAAQLTAAWAARIGQPKTPTKPVSDEIFDRFADYRNILLRER